MAASKARRGFGWSSAGKRRSLHAEIDYEKLGIELAALSQAPQPVCKSAFVYDMESREDRIECIRQLWKPNGLEQAEGSLAQSNAALAHMLRACTVNTYRPVDKDRYEAAREMRLESTLCDLMRDSNQKHVPIWSAALSVVCSKRGLSGPLWSMISALHRGMLMSDKWTDDLLDEAVALQPPNPEPLIESVSFTVFDNYTRRCLYKSTVSAGQGGYRLDMTNYGRIRVPARLLPAGF